jgi:CRP-like cAMP-binding protein
MTITSTVASRAELQGLINAITRASGPESLINPLTNDQWDMLCGYMQVSNVPAGQTLIRKGDVDRTLFFVETGTLSVHFQDAKERVRLAIVGPGTVVGEVSFFSSQPRVATVQATGTARVWLLTALRFKELSNRQPEIALALTMVLGGLMGRRLVNRKLRIAAT